MTEVPEALSEPQAKKIVNILKEKGALGKCPRCGNPDFELQKTLTSLSVKADVSKTVLGGKNIPATIAICDNCGYIALHSLGVLGLTEEFSN